MPRRYVVEWDDWDYYTSTLIFGEDDFDDAVECFLEAAFHPKTLAADLRVFEDGRPPVRLAAIP